MAIFRVVAEMAVRQVAGQVSWLNGGQEGFKKVLKNKIIKGEILREEEFPDFRTSLKFS